MQIGRTNAKFAGTVVLEFYLEVARKCQGGSREIVSCKHSSHGALVVLGMSCWWKRNGLKGDRNIFLPKHFYLNACGSYFDSHKMKTSVLEH